MTRKLTPQEKFNRRPASRACIFCHQKHLQCSNERPCKNCVKRDIANQCRDVERKQHKYLKRRSVTGRSSRNESPSNELDHESQIASQISNGSSQISGFDSPLDHFTPTPQHVDSTTDSTVPVGISSGTMDPSASGTTDTAATTNNMNFNSNFKPDNVPESMTNTTNEVLTKLFSTSMKNSYSQDYNFDNMFDSNYLDQEYKMLGDILTNSKPTSPTPSMSVDSNHSGYNNNNISSSNNNNNNSSSNNSNNNNPGSLAAMSSLMPMMLNGKFKDTRPFISLGIPQDKTKDIETNDITSHFNNTSTDYISPMISHQVYKSVKDVYSNDIINFDYPQSYHSLTRFLKARFLGKNLSEEAKQHKRDNLLIILKLISSYRPTFISAHKSLYKPWDLQFLEMTFQRSLIDFEKLSNLNSSPTIIWRRTGEIVSISNDLIGLLGLSLHEILSKRTFIMELMYDDESIINYFKLFKSVAVGNLHSSIITKCKLSKRDDPAQPFIEFCSVWTVKRDLFDIPMLILGQFLPVLSPADGFRMY